MPKRWRIHPHDPRRIEQLQRTAGVSAVLAQLLVCRGIVAPEEIENFLAPKLTGLRDPGELPGASEAARRLAAAVADGRRIVIYGDYDADGMTATSILLLCLKMLGANVGYYVPNRIDEGYGLNDEALRNLARDGAQLVITNDCGIASVKEATTARELGLELIITDHHEMADALPAADAIVHPRLPGHNYPFAGLCGAAVAFKVAWALCQEVSQNKRVPERMKNFLLQAVGLAALGTVADVVPLVDENRVLVRHGLNSLFQMPTLGMAKLLEITQLDQKPFLASEDVAFTLAPRLNAAGRLGQAQLAIELLTTDSPSRAEALAEYIHELNNSRASLERSVYLAANKQAQELCDPENDAALVLADRGWHPGVIGIVAGRLAEKFHRPVVLVALDQLGVKPGVGSARSIPGFRLHEALAACSHHLLGHGGHAAAAGLQIEEGNIEAFREAFCEYASGELNAGDLTAELRIDAEAAFSMLTPQTVQQIEQLAPFGHGNSRPLFCATGVKLAEPPKRIGGGGRHVSMKLVQHGVKMRAVAFGQGDWADELTDLDAPLAVAFQPVINHFRGRMSVELHLADWQFAEQPAATR
jgi:single-stranded-DNA-specific exonuclease